MVSSSAHVSLLQLANPLLSKVRSLLKMPKKTKLALSLDYSSSLVNFRTPAELIHTHQSFAFCWWVLAAFGILILWLKANIDKLVAQFILEHGHFGVLHCRVWTRSCVNCRLVLCSYIWWAGEGVSGTSSCHICIKGWNIPVPENEGHHRLRRIMSWVQWRHLGRAGQKGRRNGMELWNLILERAQ